MARRASDARREASHRAPVAVDGGAVDKMLASACQAGSTQGDFEHDGGESKCFPGGVVVTRLTDDSGNPIGYLLTSDDTAQSTGGQEHPPVERRGTRAA